jgi:MoaA/NifB/PqqE/SkfB family radical SAM enzyme
MRPIDIYSQLKPAWHQNRINALREGRQPRPIHVQLVISDLCNQDCYFCAYRMTWGLSSELFAVGQLAKVGTNNPKRIMPREKALEIVEDCAALGVKAIQFTGGGEPTVHPNHIEIINRAQLLGMETALVTNGQKLDATSSTIKDLKWIRVSIDAGSREMYARIRRVPLGHWDKAWGNVRALRMAGYGGVLGIGYVATPENYEGIPEAARLAKECGADNMRVGAVFSGEGTAFYGGVIQPIIDTIHQAKQEFDEEDGFTIIDLFGRRLNDLEQGSPDDPACYYQYLTPYIGGDLSVYRCCNTAYTLAGKVADLRKTRLKDAKLQYEPFDARKCFYCQFRGQNKAIGALVHEPTHVNFV